jgi:hypothetical protein
MSTDYKDLLKSTVNEALPGEEGTAGGDASTAEWKLKKVIIEAIDGWRQEYKSLGQKGLDAIVDDVLKDLYKPLP